MGRESSFPGEANHPAPGGAAPLPLPPSMPPALMPWPPLSDWPAMPLPSADPEGSYPSTDLEIPLVMGGKPTGEGPPGTSGRQGQGRGGRGAGPDDYGDGAPPEEQPDAKDCCADARGGGSGWPSIFPATRARDPQRPLGPTTRQLYSWGRQLVAAIEAAGIGEHSIAAGAVLRKHIRPRQVAFEHLRMELLGELSVDASTAGTYTWDVAEVRTAAGMLNLTLRALRDGVVIGTTILDTIQPISFGSGSMDEEIRPWVTIQAGRRSDAVAILRYRAYRMLGRFYRMAPGPEEQGPIKRPTTQR